MINGLEILTGLRGNGKTLYAIGQIQKEIDEGRVVACVNINGLNIPGVIICENPSEWPTLPSGALMVIDEAQRFWRASRSSEIPKELTDMETARHNGISHLLITQHPSFLHSHLRKLCDTHRHFIRRAGFPMSQMFKWEGHSDDPVSPSEKARAEESIFNFPKKDFGKYKSAEVHTIKGKIPKQVYFIVGALLFVALAFGFAVNTYKSKVKPESAPDSVNSGLPESREGSATPTNLAYSAKILPTQPNAPWTAPGFASRNFASHPRVYCMSTASTCNCLTEQGTKYVLSDEICRYTARNGMPYNPFKQEQRDNQQPRNVNRTLTAAPGRELAPVTPDDALAIAERYPEDGTPD